MDSNHLLKVKEGKLNGTNSNFLFCRTKSVMQLWIGDHMGEYVVIVALVKVMLVFCVCGLLL